MPRRNYTGQHSNNRIINNFRAEFEYGPQLLNAIVHISPGEPDNHLIMTTAVFIPPTPARNLVFSKVAIYGEGIDEILVPKLNCTYSHIANPDPYLIISGKRFRAILVLGYDTLKRINFQSISHNNSWNFTLNCS